MLKFVPVTIDGHARKKWRRFSDFKFASSETVAPIIDGEVGRAAVAMPLAFIQQSGEFVLVAVLSLTPGLNSLVAPNGDWQAGYVPAAIRFHPFRMLSQQFGGEAILCVDEDSGLITESVSDGEEFFTADGIISPAIRTLLAALVEFDKSRIRTNQAVAALAKAGLIVPWSITLRTEEGDQSIEGLHRIDEATLNALSNDAFVKLREVSALSLAYGQLFSQQRLSIFRSLNKQPSGILPHTALPSSIDHLFDQTESLELNFD